LREQRDAARADRGGNPLTLHELCVQPAVDQLVPVGMNRRWQFPGSEPGYPDGMHPWRELARISEALNLHQLPDLRRFAERHIPTVNVNSPGEILDDGGFEFRQCTRNHTADK